MKIIIINYNNNNPINHPSKTQTNYSLVKNHKVVLLDFTLML